MGRSEEWKHVPSKTVLRWTSDGKRKHDRQKAFKKTRKEWKSMIWHDTTTERYWWLNKIDISNRYQLGTKRFKSCNIYSTVYVWQTENEELANNQVFLPFISNEQPEKGALDTNTLFLGEVSSSGEELPEDTYQERLAGLAESYWLSLAESQWWQ